MPTYKWTTPFTDAVKSLGSRDTEAEALAAWADWTVDELHYLHDLDASGSGLSLGHNPHVVELAHARWATGAAITALDLCAAALGRHYGLRRHKFELDLKELKDAKNISVAVKGWLQDVWSDTDYQLVLSARRALTHARLPRRNYIGSPDPTELRVDLYGKEVRVSIPDLIRKATDVATRHVEKFLADAKADRF